MTFTTQTHTSFETVAGRGGIAKRSNPDGSIILHSTVPLEDHPFRLTERLKHWAAMAPTRVFIGQRNAHGAWETLTYSETFGKVQSVAQALLQREVSDEKPIAILSENKIEHALIALAALHIGVPYAPINPTYALRSTDFEKIKRIIKQLSPGLLFVGDGQRYEQALKEINVDCEIVSAGRPVYSKFTSFDEFLSKKLSSQVEEAFQNIKPETVAKILYTSGSTGVPKGVINTHENISANWQQITQTLPFLKEKGLEIVDWLPWSHTFGGNHNFGIALYNGGSFYIDEGSPTPQGILTTVRNLKDRNPTIYFNVPKGFEAMIPFFKDDEELRGNFFGKLKMLFYAAASMPPHVCDTWVALGQTVGRKIKISTALGCTESCPAALMTSERLDLDGYVGVPVPGLELKLLPLDGKWEARYRGKNIFPGYWRQPELTHSAFDGDGFYRTGDALKFVDEADVNQGMIFDGRIAEDFKLNTGTWVNVGLLRSKLIAACDGLIQDAIITGHNDDFVGAIMFPALEACKKISGLDYTANLKVLVRDVAVREKLRDCLAKLAAKSTGSSTLISRAILADFQLRVEKGEITEKGTINQRLALENHAEIVRRIHQGKSDTDVIEIPFQQKR